LIAGVSLVTVSAVEEKHDTSRDSPFAERTKKAWDQIKTRAREAWTWGQKVSRVGKLKLDLAKMQRDRTALYQELGRKTYELAKGDRFDPSQLQDLTTRIDEIAERIVAQEQRVQEAAKKEASA
jgi:hypothetical protein